MLGSRNSQAGASDTDEVQLDLGPVHSLQLCLRASPEDSPKITAAEDFYQAQATQALYCRRLSNLTWLGRRGQEVQIRSADAVASRAKLRRQEQAASLSCEAGRSQGSKAGAQQMPVHPRCSEARTLHHSKVEVATMTEDVPEPPEPEASDPSDFGGGLLWSHIETLPGSELPRPWQLRLQAPSPRKTVREECTLVTGKAGFQTIQNVTW